jgi:hypothetical protein
MKMSRALRALVRPMPFRRSVLPWILIGLGVGVGLVGWDRSSLPLMIAGAVTTIAGFGWSYWRALTDE